MADSENKIKTTVELDTTEARQEIIKLNSKAADSTQDLEDRVAAKNKQVKLQEQLSKKTIDSLTAEAKEIKKVEGESKNYEKVQKKLNGEILKATKLSVTNSKQQSKLSESLADSKNATLQLDNATGGLLGKLKAFATNPIGLVVIALAGAFKLVSEAIGRSEKASAAFGKIGAKLSALFNGLIAFITPVVELLGEALVTAIEQPEKAWDSLVETFEAGYNFMKKQVMDRFEGRWKIFSGLFEAGVLKMRIAWNDFTGDSEEADQLRVELDKALDKVNDGVGQLKKANQAILDVVGDAAKKVGEIIDESVRRTEKAVKATEALENSERKLVKNRLALEQEQLRSLRLAEEQRQIRDDILKTIPERIAANKKLGEILDAQSKKELALAEENLRFAKLQVEATGEGIENIEKIGEAELKLLEIRERITGQRSEQLVNETGLLVEQADFEKLALENTIIYEQSKLAQAKKRGEETLEYELSLLSRIKLAKLDNERLTQEEIDIINQEYKAGKEDAEKEDADKKEAKRLQDLDVQFQLDELEIQRLAEKGKNVLDRELELLEQKRIQDVAAANLSAEQIQLINEKAEKEKANLRKISEEAEKAKENAVLNNALNGAAETFGIAQEVAVAKTILAAPEAVANSFKAASTYPVPLNLIMGALGAAGSVVPIIKGLKDIKKVRFTKGGRGAGGQPAGQIVTNAVATGASTVQTPQVASDLISNLAANNSSRLGVDTDLGATAAATASSNIVGAASRDVVFSEDKYEDFKSQVAFKEDKTTLK